MAKQEALFEESSQGAVGVTTAISFILAMVFVFGGIILMGYGVNIELGTVEIWTFVAGLVASTIGFLIPFTILPAIGK